MHDDLFAITADLATAIPVGGLSALCILLVSILLALIKSKAAESLTLNRSGYEKAPPVCTFPLCGKCLESLPATSRVQSKYCNLEYCSTRCFKRDWRENNHPSVAILLKRRQVHSLPLTFLKPHTLTLSKPYLNCMQKELQWQRDAVESFTLNPFKTLTKPP
jgi:hypothetical protein